jgi:hypothetical protein
MPETLAFAGVSRFRARWCGQHGGFVGGAGADGRASQASVRCFQADAASSEPVHLSDDPSQ